MLLPAECFQQLKCSLCKRLLSVFPIYIVKNDQQSSVCGRCQLPDNENYLRCEIYENLAKNVLFPCIYNPLGCTENLLPENVKQHELICSYQVQTCIFNEQNNCNWKGLFHHLLEHYKTQHDDLYLKNNQFEFNITENHEISNILQYDDELFNFKLNFNHLSQQLKCSIIPVGHRKRTKTYYGQIDLTTDDNTTISKKFPKIDFIENDTKSIDLNIENMLNENDSVVKGTVIIVDNEEKFSYVTKQNQKLVKLMKCTSCNDILHLNVYNCNNGHYTCYKCKDECCSITTLDKSVKKILKFIYNRCPYGCNFIGNRSDLKLHWFTCLYKPTCCLLEEEINCKWNGCRKDLQQHIYQQHIDRIIKLNKNVLLVIDITSKKIRERCKFINFSNNLFRLIISYKFQSLSFELTVINTITDVNIKNLEFEIHLCDKDNNQEIIMRRSFEESSIFRPLISLHMDQFRDLISENRLSFKVNIITKS